MKSKVLIACCMCFMLIFSTITAYGADVPKIGDNTNSEILTKSDQEIEIDYIEIVLVAVAKNESSEHALPTGSGSMGLMAKVHLTDGTIATGDMAGVDWSITREDGGVSQCTLSPGTKDGMGVVGIYVPFTEKIGSCMVRASSKIEPYAFDLYEIIIFKPTEGYSPKSFFTFQKGTIKGTKITGASPKWAETWDKDSKSYSTILPENTYKASGYQFAGWKGQNGKQYKPGTKVTRLNQSGPFRFTAVWKGAKVKTPTGVRVKRAGLTSTIVWWRKVAGADGYKVYRWDKAAKKYKSVKTLKGNSATKLTEKKLSSNKTYTYKVKAYRILQGKTYYSAASYWVSAKTYYENAKAVNAGKVKVSPKTVTLSLNSTKAVQLKATIIPSKVSTAKGKKVISNKIRWVSSNANIATVGNDAKVKANKKAGTCYIYARAHDGVIAKVKVVVK